MTSQTQVMTGAQVPRSEALPPRILLVALWQAIVAIGLFAGAVFVWNMPQYAAENSTINSIVRLGDIVRYILVIFISLLGVASLYSAALILRMNNSGRLVAILLDFFLFGISVLLFGQLLGLFIGIDKLGETLWRNAVWLLGFPIGYAVVWASNKLFAEGDSMRDNVQKVGLGIMMIALFVILWQGGLAQSALDFVSALVQPATFISGIVMVLFLLAGITLVRSGTAFGETNAQRESWQGWLFLLPNFTNFLLFFAMPLLLSFYLSFTEYNVISPAEWTGLDNYASLVTLEFRTLPIDQPSGGQFSFGVTEIASIGFGTERLVIGARDPMFWISLGNTFRYCFMLLLLGVFPALLLALLLNSKIPGMQIYRAVFFLPSIAAVVGVALIWQWLYDPVIGFINYALNGLFPGTRINWLSDPNVMLVAVVIMAAWQVIGFNAVIFLAGLQAVPRELMEAGKVDGASPVTRFLRITLPLLAPTTFFVTVTTLISGLQAFSEMYVLLWATSDNARLTTVYYLYEEGFERFQFGNASATAWLLFGVIFIVTLIQFRLSNRNSAYGD
jgi:ABC-type sugar transport system permease subunit